MIVDEDTLDGSSLMGPTGVQFGLPRVHFARESPNGCGATQAYPTPPCGLNGKRFAHNRAATGNGLQVGHDAATGGSMATGSSRREGSQSCWRRLLQEGAHGLGLAKDSVHVCSLA